MFSQLAKQSVSQRDLERVDKNFRSLKSAICFDPFRNNTHLVAKFTVRFKGTGYKEIQLLETNLASRGMLGNAPVKLISMTANDGQYVTMAV